MIDRISATARTVYKHATVYVPQPSFIVELLLVLIVLLCIAWAVAVAQAAPLAAELHQARHDAQRWKAKAAEPFYGVRVERDGAGFRCQTHNVRREWEGVIAIKCQELGGLLLFARAIP